MGLVDACFVALGSIARRSGASRASSRPSSGRSRRRSAAGTRFATSLTLSARPSYCRRSLSSRAAFRRPNRSSLDDQDDHVGRFVGDEVGRLEPPCSCRRSPNRRRPWRRRRSLFRSCSGSILAASSSLDGPREDLHARRGGGGPRPAAEEAASSTRSIRWVASSRVKSGRRSRATSTEPKRRSKSARQGRSPSGLLARADGQVGRRPSCSRPRPPFRRRRRALARDGGASPGLGERAYGGADRGSGSSSGRVGREDEELPAPPARIAASTRLLSWSVPAGRGGTGDPGVDATRRAGAAGASRLAVVVEIDDDQVGSRAVQQADPPLIGGRGLGNPHAARGRQGLAERFA